VDADEIESRLAALDASRVAAAAAFAGALDGRLAVLPSAFNPPTLAHLALLRRAADLLGSRPGALLTTRNVSKGVEGASLADRVAMLLAVRQEDASLAVLAANAARFVDQARALRAALPDTAIDFVAGYDTLIRIFDPAYYGDMASELDEFFRHHRLVAATRGDDDLRAIERFIAEAAAAHAGRVLSLELPQFEASLSSTLARRSPAERRRVVPAAVADYIEGHGLYGTEPGGAGRGS
jgi:nicotinic acid mononucleotide adenylyltransferase